MGPPHPQHYLKSQDLMNMSLIMAAYYIPRNTKKIMQYSLLRDFWIMYIVNVQAFCLRLH